MIVWAAGLSERAGRCPRIAPAPVATNNVKVRMKTTVRPPTNRRGGLAGLAGKSTICLREINCTGLADARADASNLAGAGRVSSESSQTVKLLPVVEFMRHLPRANLLQLLFRSRLNLSLAKHRKNLIRERQL